MVIDPPKLPEHVVVYQRLRDMILSGELAPGQAVTIQGLVGALACGATPAREAIRRLTSEGALQFQGNRRVTVPILTRDQIEELRFARLALEPELVRRASRRLGDDTLSLLIRADAALNAAIAAGDVRGYMLHNHAFHMQLYRPAACDIVISLVQALWLRVAPSLRIMCGRFGTQNLPDLHQQAIAALRRGDGEAAAQAIRDDINQGLDNVRAVLAPRHAKAMPA